MAVSPPCRAINTSDLNEYPGPTSSVPFSVANSANDEAAASNVAAASPLWQDSCHYSKNNQLGRLGFDNAAL